MELTAILGIVGALALVISIVNKNFSIGGYFEFNIWLDSRKQKQLRLIGVALLAIAIALYVFLALLPVVVDRLPEATALATPTTTYTQTSTTTPTATPTPIPTLTSQEEFEILARDFFVFLELGQIEEALSLTTPSFQQKIRDAGQVEDWIAYWEDREIEIVQVVGGHADSLERGGVLHVEVFTTLSRSGLNIQEHLIYTFVFVYLDERKGWAIAKIGNIEYKPEWIEDSIMDSPSSRVP